MCPGVFESNKSGVYPIAGCDTDLAADGLEFVGRNSTIENCNIVQQTPIGIANRGIGVNHVGRELHIGVGYGHVIFVNRRSAVGLHDQAEMLPLTSLNSQWGLALVLLAAIDHAEEQCGGSTISRNSDRLCARCIGQSEEGLVVGITARVGPESGRETTGEVRNTYSIKRNTACTIE